MNKYLKISIIIAVALSILAGGGYGAWYAWDNGLIGHNPRAPVASAMEDAVRKQALINLLKNEASAPCISVDIGHPAPEISGFHGITPAAVPGRFSITLLRQTNLRDQAVRDIQLGQMDYLTSQGFFTATDSNVESDNGTLPARNYQMTWKGYADNQLSYGNSLCFDYGRREFAGIEKIEKLLETVMDLDVYEVTYATKQTNPPAWTQSPDAKRWFPKLQQLTEDSTSRVKVIRTKEGWRSAYEIEIEAAQAAKGPTTANNYLLEMQKNLLRQPPGLEEAKQLIAGQSTDTNWLSRNGIACLPLQLQRGGDDKPAPGNMRPAETSTPFTVTYYDKPDRKEYELRMMYKTLYVLTALEHAGLARMEHLKPPRPTRKRAKENVPLSPDAQYGGVRYTLTPEAAEALGLTNYGGGCIPAGRITLELLSVQGNRGTYQIKARGVLAQTPDWAIRIGEKLPALRSLIDNGIQMSGQLGFANLQGEEKWRLNGLSPNYPDMNYNAMPQHLAPMLPRTLAAFPNKQIKAPALMEPTPLPAAYGTAQPAAAPAAPYTTPPAAPYMAPSVAPAAPLVSAPNRPTPYPAQGAPVHVVSIYQAHFPKDMPRQFQEHPEGIVNLKVSTDDAVLLLLAYEPIEWHIEAARGIELKQVIAIGYYEPRVTFSGGGKPKVHVTKKTDIMQRMGINLSNGFPTRSEANDLINIATATRALTDAEPATFQASSEAPASGFSIGAQTPAFVLPLPQKPSPTGTPITLQSDFTGASIGNKLLRGMSGAYTDAWSDHAFSAGKLYYEGKMKVTGSLSAHTHANIGLCLERDKGIDVPSMPGGTTVISHGEQRLYKEGDIFGIAADFDQNRLYFSVNGKWLSGTPGSGNGFPLEKGKQYRACVLAAGTTIGDVKRGEPQSDTTWEVNFGEKPFQSPKPSGYISFNGSK